MRRRSTPRARRVLATPTAPQRSIEAPAANLWSLGLNTLGRFRRFYPASYAAHVANRPLTECFLANVCEAFLAHVHDEVPLLDILGFRLSDNPTELLVTPAMRRLDDLDELVEALHRPMPQAYGIGLQEFMDDGEPEPSLLTLALWWLGSRTEWGLGVDFSEMAEWGVFGDVGMALVESLRPLPDDADMTLLCAQLPADAGVSGARIGPLISYAYARTGMYLADWTDTEIEFQAYNTLTWDELPELRAEVARARQLQVDYGRWTLATAANPTTILPALADALHAAVKLQRTRRERSQALIDILVPTFTEDSHGHNIAALAPTPQALA